MESILSYVGENFSTTSEVSMRGGKYVQSSSTLNTGCKTRKGGILNSKEFTATTLVIVEGLY
jgi:hypothetical protein